MHFTIWFLCSMFIDHSLSWCYARTNNMWMEEGLGWQEAIMHGHGNADTNTKLLHVTNPKKYMGYCLTQVSGTCVRYKHGLLMVVFVLHGQKVLICSWPRIWRRGNWDAIESTLWCMLYRLVGVPMLLSGVLVLFVFIFWRCIYINWSLCSMTACKYEMLLNNRLGKLFL